MVFEKPIRSLFLIVLFDFDYSTKCIPEDEDDGDHC